MIKHTYWKHPLHLYVSYCNICDDKTYEFINLFIGNVVTIYDTKRFINET